MTEYEQTIVAAGADVLMGDYKWWSDDFRGELRHGLINQYGFAIPSEDALSALAAHAPLLEVGAGAGYWAYELRKKGVDIVATDRLPVPPGGLERSMDGASAVWPFKRSWTTVLPMTAPEALRTYPRRTLFICWPSLGEPWAAECLDAYDGDTLLYVGEWNACCADERFFELIEERFDETAQINIPRWFGIHDRFWVFTRK